MGTNIEHRLFFLKLFGRPRQKSWDIPPKSLVSLAFEGHTEVFGPHPFTLKTPTPPENIRTKKFGLGGLYRKGGTPKKGGTLAPPQIRYDSLRAILLVRPKCSHRCVSLKEFRLRPVQILQHATRRSTEETSMRTEWFKHIAI